MSKLSKHNEEALVELLTEIRNWIRAAAHGPVKVLLASVLPDVKTRAAYQMLDGTVSFEQVRTSCKMSPNAVVALANRCVAAGLMAVNADKKRVRLFDLADFGLINGENMTSERGSRERARKEK